MNPLSRVVSLFVIGLFIVVSVGRAQSVRTVTDTVAIEMDGEVDLKVAAGSVHVATWDRPAVGMKARIDDGTTDAREEARVLMERDGHTVSIGRDGDEVGDVGLLELLGFGTDEGPETHYALQVPHTVSLSVSSKSAGVEVNGLEGDVTIEGASSPVRLRSISGKSTIATFSGSLHAKEILGGITFATFSGDATVHFRTVGHDGQFASFSGNVVLTLPAEAAFDLRTDLGWGGSVRSEFEGMDGSAEEEGSISVGGGGPTLAVESFSGNLMLKAE